MTILVEMLLAGVWTDVSQYVDQRSPLIITRGRRNEGTNVEAMQTTLTFNNRDGRFSPRNPNSPYYGKFGRNTLVRITRDGSIRAVGEAAAWPQKWEVSDKDAWTDVVIAGILRRLGQGQVIKNYGLPRYISTTHPAFYHPCTINGSGTQALTNSLGHVPIYGPQLQFDHCFANVHFGLGDLGANLPKGMAVDTTNRVVDGNGYVLQGRITGQVSIPNDATAVALFFVFRCDALGPMTVYLVDNAYPYQKEWDVDLRADGTNNDIKLTVREGDPDNGPTVTVLGTTAANILDDVAADGLPHTFMMTLTESGANVNWNIYLDGVSVLSGTRNSRVVDGFNFFALTYQPGTGSRPVAIGQITAWRDANIPAASNLSADGSLFAGETAGRRIERLCSENGIAFTSSGDLDDTVRMGAQGGGGLVSLLQEAAAADMGILYEPRDSLGLKYRTRASLYNQTAGVTLDYSAKMLGSVPDVLDDDQDSKNDIVVSDANGGQAEAVLTTGPLSIQPPPDGINTYPGSATVNTETAGPLDDIAAWLLHMNTIDEARYPSIHVDLLNPAVAGVLAAIKTLDIGDRLDITNLPATWIPPGGTSQLAQGYTETHTQFSWDQVFNTTPQSPYQVAVYATSTSVGTTHFDAEDSSLAAGCTSGATSLSVKSAANTALWTTDSAAFPFDIGIGGEQITVTNITGASSPQTFTVSRSVNGIVKAHLTDDDVRLWITPIYAL
jgi:hypothetical protein